MKKRTTKKTRSAKTKKPVIDARPDLATLEAKGWTPTTIADAMGTSAGRVYHWRRGASCRRLAELHSLILRPVPRTGVVDHSQPRSGSRSARRAVSAHAVRLSKVDRRQLVLAFEKALDAVLA